VNTRLAKLDKGEVAATLLAVAGLKRLGLEHRVASALPLDLFLPAVAQGAIGIECREADETSLEMIAAINHAETFLTVSCERALLARLDGSCKTPMGGLATLNQGTITLLASVILPDGSRKWIVNHSARASESIALGIRAADDLLAQMNDDNIRLDQL
jgi:hydroxymethylbilane synthase